MDEITLDIEKINKMMEEMANTDNLEILPPNTGWPHGYQYKDGHWYDWNGKFYK